MSTFGVLLLVCGRRITNAIYKPIRQKLSFTKLRTIVAGAMVLFFLRTLQYASDRFNDYGQYYFKVQNLEISGDFLCKSSITNNSCTFVVLRGMNVMEICWNLKEKCKGFTYNIGPKTVTLKSRVEGKPKFTLGVQTHFKIKYKHLLRIKEQDVCAPKLASIKKQSGEPHNKLCGLPQIDPFDPTIMRMIDKVPPLVCKGEKNLTFYRNGKLMITPGANVREVKYHVLRGKTSSGVGYDVAKSGILTPSKPEALLNEDMVHVEITKNSGEPQLEFHMEVNARAELLNREAEIKPGIPINVMMIGLDSTSHAHFKRKLGPVYKYMKEKLHSYMFEGYSVVGDGTTPALVGLLVGKHMHEAKPEGRKGIYGATCVDKWPWVFKDMKRHGYVTYYNEDEMYNGAITTRLKGFCKPPIDHYLLPLWYAALDKLNSMYDKVLGQISYIKGHCLSSQAIYNISLNTITSFFEAYPNTPKFGFHMNSDFCHHENFNFISIVEDDLLNFLKHMKAKKYLNNTILIIFGDHGLRYGFVRSSLLGRMEERLPFLSMTFPTWFKKKYPELMKNFEQNSKVLTSPFDVHATLLHLLSYPKEPKGLPHGKSLFTDIGWRTCKQAGIPFHFCPCVDWSAVNVTSVDIKSSALAAVEMINEKLAKQGLQATCAKLELKRIISAVMINAKGGDDRENRGVDKTKDITLRGGCIYQLQISTSPNNGSYEATVQMNSGIPQVNPHVSRVNEYGDEADCIRTTHPLLRELCYCVSKT